MAIIKRLVKGTALTHVELDGNFTDLDGRVTTLETADTTKSQVTSSSIGALSDVDTTGVTANSILKYNASTSKFEISSDATGGGGGGINNLVEDTTPQLGGVLDANGQNIDMGINFISDAKVGQWDTAYSWGDHSLAGYVTSTATELVTDTTPQLGGDLDTNSNNINFSGTDKAQFGAAQDLGIWHNGSHSIIRETGTGSLYLQSDNNVILGKDSSSETMVKGIADGAVELYHDNSKKFETTANGVSVTGNLAADGSQIDFTSLPTSDPGVAGRLFRSGNDVKISTG